MMNMSMNLLEAVIGLRRAATRAASGAFGEQLSSRHVAVLRELRASGPCSQAQVARATALDPSLVVRVLDDLEGQGLVKRSRNEQDRRAMVVTLTEAGRKALGPADAAYRRLANAMQRPLTPEERDTFIALAGRIIRALEAASARAGQGLEHADASH